MRYIKDILLEKAVLHVIDQGADEPILAKSAMPITIEVEEFVRKHVIKSLNSEDTFEARFLGSNTLVAQSVKEVIEDESVFMDMSKAMALHMYESIRDTDIQSADLLVVQYIADEQRCWAVMKLDFETSHKHTMNFINEDELWIELVSEEGGLPSTGKALKKCLFFTKGSYTDDNNTGIEALVIDKTIKSESGDADFFMDKFVEGVKISDFTSKTRDLKKVVEKWTQRNLSDQIELANQTREAINEYLIEEELGGLESIIEAVNFEEPELTEALKDELTSRGYREGEKGEFLIDKDWVEKKMKKRQIKTDTGVVINAEHDFFRDCQRFAIKANGDGTVDYIIKGVRNFVEK